MNEIQKSYPGKMPEKNVARDKNMKERREAAIFENRLSVLKVLSQTILSELDFLEQYENRMNFTKVDLVQAVQDYETDLIKCALVKTGGHQRLAAKMLNIKVTTLNAKIKRYGITPIGLETQME